MWLCFSTEHQRVFVLFDVIVNGWNGVDFSIYIGYFKPISLYITEFPCSCFLESESELEPRTKWNVTRRVLDGVAATWYLLDDKISSFVQ